ncbi:MAG: hypothetical protein KAT16_08305, partial [Candidatus Heimdallarchaeota archaeon]|nr:hypothetical protein [Candidatus Heimdallarchaeota archaeon]
MSTESESKSSYFEHPFLFGLIVTLIYGFVVYLPDFLNLEDVLFTSNLSPFASIFFTFISRFILSGLLLIFLLPIALYLMKGISSQDFVCSIRLHPNRISSRNILLGLIVSVS